MTRILVGCAGWTISRMTQELFPGPGTHLARYAARLSAVEIDSSFYRPHRASTYARWAESVPDRFRFSVKLPKAITHERRLGDSGSLLLPFLASVSALGHRLGCLLVQTSPSLAFESRTAGRFLEQVREQYDGGIAFEPRHESWFGPTAEKLFRGFRIARVAADPARSVAGREPGGWLGLTYYRLHGTPRMYYSAYSSASLRELASRLVACARDSAGHSPVWCIFDNTALGAALPNALELLAELSDSGATC